MNVKPQKIKTKIRVSAAKHAVNIGFVFPSR